MNNMNSNVQLFSFEETQVRILTIDGEPWFVGNDVASVLGYKRSAKAIQDHVDEEDVETLEYKACPEMGLAKLWSGNDFSDKKLVNESGLYSLILSSKLPAAKKFNRWVTSVVLPSIRKHGAYMTDRKAYDITHDKSGTALADLLQQAADQLKQKDIQIEEMKPKAKYCDIVLQNKRLVTITQIAKDYGMSGQKMNCQLHDLKVIFKQGGTWLLYSKYQNTGWTQSETFITHKQGENHQKVVLHTKWTQKGRLGLYELLKSHDILPLIEIEENNQRS